VLAEKKSEIMKRLLCTSAMVLNFWAISHQAAIADSNAIQTDLEKGAAAAQAGKMDAAEKAFQKAFDDASATNDQAHLCQAALQLGIVETGLHKYSQAEKALQTGLRIASAVMPPHSPFEALMNSLLADLYFQEGRPAEALPLYLSSIPNLPATPPILQAEKTINLALCYTRLDKMDLAASSFEKGIAAFTNAVGPDDAQTLGAMVNYANFQFQRGNDEKAFELAQKVLSSKTENKAAKAVANNILAHVYDRQEKFGKAMRVAQNSLNENKTSGSTDLVNQAMALLTIGKIYKHGHKYRDAEVAINKALELLKGYPDNTDYSDAIREKCDLFILQGQYEKAEPLANQSMSLRVKYLGADNSDVAQNLADLGYIYQQETKFTDAETAYKNALSIYKKGRGERNPEYIETLAKLADLYRLMGKKSEAENTLGSVLDLRRSTLPADSPIVARTVVSLASLYKEDQQAAKAAQLLGDLVNKDQSSANSAQKAGLLQELASAQVAEGKPEQAASTRKQAGVILGTLFEASSSSGDSGSSTGTGSGANLATGAFTSTGATSGATSGTGVVSTTPTEKSNSAGTKPGSDTAAKGDKWCLAVGISNFKDTSINLKYSAKDATDFKDFLIAKGNFKPDHVKLLVDESATRQNLIDQLGDGWLANRVKPDDLVVVYISSHGSQAMDEAKGVNFLVTYDTNKNSLLATGIPMQWLSKIIAEQVKSQHTLIMLDVCHSGSAADWSDDGSDSIVIASSGMKGDKGLQRILTSDPHSVVPSAGQVILCSSAKSQQSWESQEYPNSVFTKRLMDALNSKGSGTKLGDAFTVLKTNVEGEVLRDRNQLQTPQISISGKGNLLSPLSEVH
jgi:tetratricopeptide (TPR) repeat protein/uncharacterized caspase-like protein